MISVFGGWCLHMYFANFEDGGYPVTVGSGCAQPSSSNKYDMIDMGELIHRVTNKYYSVRTISSVHRNIRKYIF